MIVLPRILKALTRNNNFLKYCNQNGTVFSLPLKLLRLVTTSLELISYKNWVILASAFVTYATSTVQHTRTHTV